MPPLPPLLLRKNPFSFIFSCCAFFLLLMPPAYAQLDVLKGLYERAVNAYNNQRYQQAMDLYQQIVKAAPGFAPAYNGMALANQQLGGDEDKTIEYLKMAVSLNPKMSQAYDNLGKIYYDRQDIDHAQGYFEKALKINPDLIAPNVSLAWINLLVRSKPSLALKYFKKALPQDQDPKIYYGMGLAYFSGNHRVAAMDMITKLHELGQEDLAERLEKSMRDNARVNIAAESGGGPSSTPAGLGPLPATSGEPTGIKVHLRGRLSDY